ncbi:hypothetical protein G3M53_50175, partial [Streptomyces sp. SID7982]|nr:hypothetical protein [Streptomyces sp. SID7982]
MNGQPISGASAGTSGKRRGGPGLLALVLGALLVLVTACGGGGADAGDKKGPAGGTKKEDTTASQAVVTIAPKDGADSVATSGALKIGAEQGKLTTVKVADPKGNEVEGEISA